MKRLVQGNEAVFLGALRAGANFFAGYPISPSSEILVLSAEQAAREDGPDVYGPGELGPDEVGPKSAVAPPDGSGEDDADPDVIDQREMPDRDVVGPDKKKHGDENGGDR